MARKSSDPSWSFREPQPGHVYQIGEDRYRIVASRFEKTKLGLRVTLDLKPAKPVAHDPTDC